MASKTHGTAHIYGVGGTITDATVQSFTRKKSYQNVASTVNEQGNEIERRYDDKLHEVTFELKIKATSAIPDAGDNLSYDSDGTGGPGTAVTYEVVSVDEKYEAQAHLMVTVTAKKSEYVTYA